MSPERRRQLLLAVLVVLAGMVLWRMLGTPPAEGPAAAAARAAAAAAMAPPADVRLEDLSAPSEAPRDVQRNPFVFGQRPAPAPVAQRTSGPVVEAPPPVFTPPGPPPLPPIPFKFIGLVEGESSGTRIAVLSDSRGLVVHGREGAIIDGRFRILAIGAETLDIAYADGRGRQTLRLSGQ